MNTQLTRINGWSNYPTWAIASWIQNDEGLSEDVQTMTADAAEAYDLSKTLRTHFEEQLVAGEGGLAEDLIDWAIQVTNWTELAESFLSDWKADHKKEEEEEKDT